MKPEDRIIIALDVETLDEAEKIVKATAPPATYFKIGSTPFTAMGHNAIEMVKKHGGKVFLDLKWHDIPNTVVGAVSAAVALGVDMVNVHAAGGKEMMKAAKIAAIESARKLNAKPPIVIAVTVLTSFDDASYKEATCSTKSIKEQVPYLARLAKEAGLNGVVASPEEVSLIRSVVGKDFIIVTPGIRPSWSVKGDQKRATTPADAIRLGSDYMVIGRPICAAENPREAFNKVLEEMRSAT